MEDEILLRNISTNLLARDEKFDVAERKDGIFASVASSVSTSDKTVKINESHVLLNEHLVNSLNAN